MYDRQAYGRLIRTNAEGEAIEGLGDYANTPAGADPSNVQRLLNISRQQVANLTAQLKTANQTIAKLRAASN